MPSNTLRDADLSYALHPYTNLVAHETRGPLIAVRGEGVRVFDDTGKAYIEGMAGLWCASLGFSEPRLAAAAAKQMAELPFFHMFSHKAHAPGIQLSEALVTRAPVPMARAFFCNSGSEANDTAIKMIWYMNNALGRPEKKKIIARKRGYHGVTVAAASLTGLPANHRDFDLPIANILHTSSPDFYREGKPGETEEDFAKRCAADLEALILEEGPETIAAFFAEPVMGAGGVVVPPQGYFQHIQAVLKKYDVLLVADEVICGFGRTGNYWGSQTFGMEPDILTCAKALSSAYLPISAVLVTQRVYEALRDNSAKIGTFGHGYTYSAHPVAAAVALETLAIYDERNILEHVAVSGARMQERLRALSNHPLVGQARGVGLIGALELVANKETREAFPLAQGIGPKVVDQAQENGVILRAMAGDVIAFSPPLIITPEDVDEMMDRTTEALDTIAASL
jgi:4-aminobutyrate--pyruvate transaminase